MSIDEKVQADLYAGLNKLTLKIFQFEQMSPMNKISHGSDLITETRDLLSAVISNQHALSNAIERLYHAIESE